MKSLHLLTIIAEEVLANQLEKEIVAMGARGYTASPVSGKGLQELRDNQWEGENVKIETIVSADTCNKILAFLQEKYFERYAMIAFHHPVEVVRTSHFI